MSSNNKNPSFLSKVIAFCILGSILMPFIQIAIFLIIIVVICAVVYFVFRIIRDYKSNKSYTESNYQSGYEDKRKQDYLFYSQFSENNKTEKRHDDTEKCSNSITFEFENTVESFDSTFFKAVSYLDSLSTNESQNKFLHSFFEKIENNTEISDDVLKRAAYAKEYIEFMQEMKEHLGLSKISQTGCNKNTYYYFINTSEANEFTLSMSGHEFEEYCANLLKLNGFSSVETTKTSGDQGIDIIAFKHGVKYGIQCKLYSKPVGNSAVQEAYAGKDFYNCNIGIVLTNNTFTASAVELAEKIGIVLWDGNYLKRELSSKTKEDI